MKKNISKILSVALVGLSLSQVSSASPMNSDEGLFSKSQHIQDLTNKDEVKKSPSITLISNEGKSFTIPQYLVNESEFIKNLLSTRDDDNEETPEIPLPEVNTATLSLL